MSRTVPRAYVTAVWNKNPVLAREEAKRYCRALVREGYLPICPVLAFEGIFTSAGELKVLPLLVNKTTPF